MEASPIPSHTFVFFFFYCFWPEGKLKRFWADVALLLVYKRYTF